MFHLFLNALVPVCGLYQLLNYNFVNNLYYIQLRLESGGVMCYYKGNLMLIIKLNIKGKLVYKAGAQSYRALICSADGSQLQF
jgi:hypothetical protein